MAEISWDLFHQQVSSCTMCPLHATVTNKVPGQGDIHSPLMLIGEGPGQREDEEGIAFVGDTIFKGSIGSTRYPGGNFSDLKRSIRGRLFKLPDNTVLLSGHSGQTTVGEEKLR